MDKKQEYWNVFTQTGRVEDYLRYRACVDEAKEATADENTDRRSDHSGDTGGRSG